MPKNKKGKTTDLDPKSKGKKVKGGIQVSDTVFDRLSPNDSRNLKKATKDVTLGTVKPS